MHLRAASSGNDPKPSDRVHIATPIRCSRFGPAASPQGRARGHRRGAEAIETRGNVSAGSVERTLAAVELRDHEYVARLQPVEEAYELRPFLRRHAAGDSLCDDPMRGYGEPRGFDFAKLVLDYLTFS